MSKVCVWLKFALSKKKKKKKVLYFWIGETSYSSTSGRKYIFYYFEYPKITSMFVLFLSICICLPSFFFHTTTLSVVFSQSLFIAVGGLRIPWIGSSVPSMIFKQGKLRERERESPLFTPFCNIRQILFLFSEQNVYFNFGLLPLDL